MNMNDILLTILWVIWSFIHSAMIDLRVTNYLKRRLGNAYRFYRLFYNLIAIVTFIAVIRYGNAIAGSVLFRWDSSMFTFVFQWIVRMIGFGLVFAGMWRYDTLQVLGISQIRNGTTHSVLTETGTLNTTGVLGITRHPIYLAVLLLFWVRELTVARLVMNIVLTIYLIVGTKLEERKLIIEFGEEYRHYQRQVSMLVPFKYFTAFPKKIKKILGNMKYSEELNCSRDKSA